ncbi:MAG: proline racemase family protein [Burkholderiales bacterium]|nr:proline racemase family protein [Burkholderiales bacterium]
MSAHAIRVVDSHTGGEPARVVVEGGPDLGGGSLAARHERFRSDFDRFRSAIVNEPRGSDVIVGALLVPPEDGSCSAGVIFFNNVGVIGMCGHCCARFAQPRCASSPSSPNPAPCVPSSPTSASRSVRPPSPRPAARRCGIGPMPGRATTRDPPCFPSVRASQDVPRLRR